jgi:hypothetical protein
LITTAPVPHTAVQFADDLLACLDAADPTATLIEFWGEMGRVKELPVTPNPYGDEPHPLTGLSCGLVASALNKSEQSDQVLPLLKEVAALFAPEHRYYVHRTDLSDLLSTFPFLFVPMIDAALAGKDANDGIALVNGFAKFNKERTVIDEAATRVLNHPRSRLYGPFHYEPAWVLDRQEKVRAMAQVDVRQQRIVFFDQLLLENALFAEAPERGLVLVGTEELNADFMARAHLGLNLGFNGVCVLAALGRSDDAMTLVRHIIRRGYNPGWRFDLEGLKRGKPFHDTRQNEWLGELAKTDAYRRFVEEDIRYVPIKESEDTRQLPLCLVHDDVLGGTKRKRCSVSRKLIEPGTAIVRFRALYGMRTSDEYLIAAKPAFEASPWQSARCEHETNSVPLCKLFEDIRHRTTLYKDPAVCALHYDVTKDIQALDIGRAARIIAEHAPPTVRFIWIKGPEPEDYRDLAFEPWAADEGHGDAVELAWRLMRGGCRETLLEAISALPQAQSDKAFAMFATFDDARLRAAAAEHFGLPDLPAMMKMTFDSRLSLADHLVIADYGRAHLRYRTGLVAAIEAYGLALYSTYHLGQGPNWWRAGLEHYAYARGGRLLFMLIHHPEDNSVMRTMVDEGWLPTGVGEGAYDAYDNSRPYFFRAAAFHIALHHPDALDSYIGKPWIRKWLSMAADRETFRLIEKLKKAARLRTKSRKSGKREAP